MKRVYFAHPMTEYGTAKERACMALIREQFPEGEWEIVNPSHPGFCLAVDILYPICGFGLFDLIASQCDATVALPFPDGLHGAGVFSEIQAAHTNKKPVFKIDPITLVISPMNFLEERTCSVAETKARIKALKQQPFKEEA